jgi:hypothetical protein
LKLRLTGRWETSGRRLPRSLAEVEADLTVNELILRFWPHVEESTAMLTARQLNEVHEYRQSFKPLKRL